jgi:RNAse (barnase) inhibitor barstar
MEPFHFNDSNLPPSPALVAEMRAGIGATENLFEELAQCLRLPDYFGANWNALEECIRDLSWLPAGPVVLRHHDLPLAGDVASQKTYLSILRGAVEKEWTVPGQQLRDLVVIFPSETREQIAWLLRSVAHDEGR